MSVVSDCLLIVGGTTVLSVAGMLIVRKRVSKEELLSCHEVGGFILSIIGTLYAILVGMIVVSSQGKVETASQMAVTEANMLSNIYHLASTFQAPTRRKIHGDIHAYAVAALKEDWIRVDEGTQEEATVQPYRHLWRDVTAYTPQGDRESQCYAKILDDLEQLSDARKYRMVSARGGLSGVLWSVLIVGGVMLVLFTYFFFVESMLSQTLMTACVAIFLSMNVFLIYIYQNPYLPELGAKDAGFGDGFNPSWFLDKSPTQGSAATDSKSVTDVKSITASKSGNDVNPVEGDKSKFGKSSKDEK